MPGAVPPDRVIELTANLADGVLSWNAPVGRWLILRLGASLTGQTNGPAPRDSTGPEVTSSTVRAWPPTSLPT